MADETKSIEEREAELKTEREQLEKDRKAVQAERQRLEGVVKEAQQHDKNVGPLKTGVALVVPSTFANVTGVTFAGSVIGGVKSIKIDPQITRVEPTTNDFVGGPVASHLTNRMYRVSIETEDMSAITLVSSTTTSATLTFKWLASQNPVIAPTLVGNQQVTIAPLVYEGQSITAGGKALGTTTLTFHTLATATDSDQLTFVATT